MFVKEIYVAAKLDRTAMCDVPARPRSEEPPSMNLGHVSGYYAPVCRRLQPCGSMGLPEGVVGQRSRKFGIPSPSSSRP